MRICRCVQSAVTKHMHKSNNLNLLRQHFTTNFELFDRPDNKSLEHTQPELHKHWLPKFHVLPVYVTSELLLCFSYLSHEKGATVIDLNDVACIN